jgi:nucleotide-binding universal stress UspA family protein
MKNLIIPIDFSKESLAGLDLAMLFSKKQKTNIQMVYVQKKSSDYNSPGYFKEEKAYAEKQFKKLVDKYSSKLKNDSKLKYIIKSGRIYREIVGQVESYDDAMVIASTHGASGFEEFFIGSNAFKIISTTHQPVITVRSIEAPTEIKKIVMPIDLTVDTRQKVPFTSELALLFDAEIHIITVSSSKSKRIIDRLNAYAAQVENYVKARKIKCKVKSFVGDNIVDLITVYSDSVDASMVSIMKEQTKSLSFYGGITHNIVTRSKVPVLSMSSKEIHIATGFSSTGG